MLVSGEEDGGGRELALQQRKVRIVELVEGLGACDRHVITGKGVLQRVDGSFDGHDDVTLVRVSSSVEQSRVELEETSHGVS